MNELFFQAGTVGVIAAISLKSLDLAAHVVKKRFKNSQPDPNGAVVDELQKLNAQMGTFLEEQARHLELSRSTHRQAKKNEELIDQVNRDVLFLKRDGRG